MNYIYGINAVAEALKARGRSFEWVGVLNEGHELLKETVSAPAATEIFERPQQPAQQQQ